MDTAREAPRLLAALFEDGGAALLRDGQLGERWDEVLLHVPPELLAVPAGPDAGLRLLVALREFWSRQQDLRPALAATRALLDLRVRQGGRQHPDALVELAALGTLAQRAGKVQEGGRLLEQAYEQLRSAVTGRDLRLAVVASNVARHLLGQDRLSEAEHALEIAYRTRKELAPLTVALTAAQLGEVRLRLGKDDAALPVLREAYELQKQRQGVEHPSTLSRGWTLGLLYNKLERWEQASVVLRPVMTAARGGEPERHAAVAFELGLALGKLGVEEEGRRLVEESVRLTRQLGERAGRPHPSLPNRLVQLAVLELGKRRVADAEGLQLEAVEAERRLHGDGSPEVAHRYAGLGTFYAKLGRTAEALGWMDAAASLLRSTLGDEAPRTRAVVEAQAGLLQQQAEEALKRRDRGAASELLRRARQLGEPVLGFTHERVRRIRDLQERHRL